MLSLTLAMAADHVREGIRVNCVSPGTADTPWVQGLLAAADDPDAERAALEARQPMGRMVSADRGRRGDRLPGRARVGLDHRHRARRRRRHAGTAAAARVTGGRDGDAQLGSSGVRVTRFALGSAPLGGLYQPVGDDGRARDGRRGVAARRPHVRHRAALRR